MIAAILFLGVWQPFHGVVYVEVSPICDSDMSMHHRWWQPFCFWGWWQSCHGVVYVKVSQVYDDDTSRWWQPFCIQVMTTITWCSLCQGESSLWWWHVCVSQIIAASLHPGWWQPCQGVVYVKVSQGAAGHVAVIPSLCASEYGGFDSCPDGCMCIHTILSPYLLLQDSPRCPSNMHLVFLLYLSWTCWIDLFLVNIWSIPSTLLAQGWSWHCTLMRTPDCIILYKCIKKFCVAPEAKKRKMIILLLDDICFWWLWEKTCTNHFIL